MTRTKLLASVSNFEEAQIVLDGGADIIDLKDPTKGALGALPLADIQRIVQHINGQRPVSATIGDLPMDAQILFNAVLNTAATKVDYIKIGFFKSSNQHECIKVLAPLARLHKLIAVCFADQQPDFSLIEKCADANFHGVMLDTANKQNGGLREHMQPIDLIEFIVLSRKHHLLCGLAGSLRLADIPALLELQPDYLGFRGALCESGLRTEKMSTEKLRAVRNILLPTSLKPTTPSDFLTA